MPKAKLSDAGPYAKPFTGADLRLVMAAAGLSKPQVAALTGYTTRSVEQWLSGTRPVPLLVRRMMRVVMLGRVSLNELWCL